MINKVVVTTSKEIVKLAENTIHFAINPTKGGIPARLAIKESINHFFIFFLLSSMVLTLNFIKKFSKIRTENQYKKENNKNNLVLMQIAIIIHPKLKTEE